MPTRAGLAELFGTRHNSELGGPLADIAIPEHMVGWVLVEPTRDELAANPNIYRRPKQPKPALTAVMTQPFEAALQTKSARGRERRPALQKTDAVFSDELELAMRLSVDAALDRSFKVRPQVRQPLRRRRARAAPQGRAI